MENEYGLFSETKQTEELESIVITWALHFGSCEGRLEKGSAVSVYEGTFGQNRNSTER